LVLISGKATYFETTSAVLGKMYSNTMMVLLNSRMVYGIANDTESSIISFIVPSLTSQVVVSVTHEQQRSDPLEIVSVIIQTLILILNLRIGEQIGTLSTSRMIPTVPRPPAIDFINDL
jgi:hypothetical protein